MGNDKWAYILINNDISFAIFSYIIINIADGLYYLSTESQGNAKLSMTPFKEIKILDGIEGVTFCTQMKNRL